jgi:RNA polymerase sigma-70 factor (ECF subfamily)
MTDENVLLQQALRYEEQALAEIYDRYSPGIYRYSWRNLGDNHLAEECVSETFSRFLHALQSGHGPQEYLQAYLYRVAHNWITDYYRRRKPPTLPLDEEIQAGTEGDPLQSAAQTFELQRVRSALELLTPEQRQVVMLKYLEDWNNDEIARAIQKPVGAVKALQHRGLAALRRLLTKREEIE